MRLSKKSKSLLSPTAGAALRLAAAIIFISATAMADDAPQWLRQAAATTMPAFDKKVPAVVLFDESKATVDEDGRITKSNYYAVKILSREGRGQAVAQSVFNTDSEKVRELRAWMISPSGEVKKYGKDRIIEAAVVDNDIYNEARKKMIIAADDAEPGAVFGYEIVTEERTVFTQFNWFFQDSIPVVVSRVSLTLPAGWRAEAVTFNHPKVEPSVNGSTYTWELRDLPHVEEEPAAPSVMTLVARLAVSYFPPPEKKASVKSFNNWADVSRWLTELTDPQAAPDDAVASKARQLTASARTELERIQMIGRYAQGINYVSIQIGTGRGGGYRPHAAAEVFAKSYGDCKDKANLMRAMLKAVGIDSYLVCIYSGDPTFVREEWPSPHQFNHCIIAVKVSDSTQAASVIKHPTLGRLLIFDPTDDNTPVGDLPDHEQGSFALVIAGEAGALMRMPTTPPELNRTERSAEVSLEADGAINALVSEKSFGQAAVSERRRFRGLSRPDYTKMIEAWITRGATGASVSKIEPTDGAEQGRFGLEVEFKAPRYAQLMQGRLLVFKPAIISRRESLFLTEGARKHAVVLEPHAYTETVKIKLPEGFQVDEVPDAVSLSAPFGSYKTSYEFKGEHLHFTRSLVLQGATIPATDYAKVRGFFEKIRAAEQSPVVLVRK
jgi:hypothetical protein